MSVAEQQLIDQIRRAFAGVRLEDGISLNMTEYHDSGGCMPEFKEKAKHDERDDWASIPDETLEGFTVTFSFTDLKGYRFYIPAYMVYTVRNHRRSNSIITDFTIYAIDPSHYQFEKVSFWEWFTRDQIDVMIKFLQYAVQCVNLDNEVAAANLAKFQNAPPRIGGDR